ncbi:MULTISPECIES: HNH endonuclease [Enterobacteriaceae]|jgi:hypothetical protein|uniref:HNH endonuclease n=1 Tax=Enterobacteriaceae TaxID=543 RepID=UPI0018EB7262|nr:MULTISPECIES: HNH endonuclease [Enterobacteriaceae]MBT1874433.1 HNH endonuclease [Enterobacter hormaechei subsp. xiangfangensis]HCM9397682.1 HNH endonuclease [Enterobacter hormaechei subsp. steigerwaltii]HEM7398333.1 HNH endonuclease [Citrobacter farmeri]MBJ6376092.1 HNH endonuclease [Enterobacter hormaechei]MCL8171567.1 HNH endonuclease [Enterobacter hormaechei]
MNNSECPSIEYLHECFSYDHLSGLMVWKVRPITHFARERDHAAWNARFAGKNAGSMNKGYWRVEVSKKPMGVHRIAWAMHYGEYPEGWIDHINGDRSDNRIINLRVTDPVGNATNQKMPANNSSGVAGVSYVPRDNKWKAYIYHGNKFVYLGYFVDKNDAIAARKMAEVKYGFHENHGR